MLDQHSAVGALKRLAAVLLRIEAEEPASAPWRSTRLPPPPSSSSSAAPGPAAATSAARKPAATGEMPGKASSLDAAPHPPPLTGGGSARVGKGSGGAARRGLASRPLVLHLKNGAADLKGHLQDANARGMPIAVAWISGGSSGADALGGGNVVGGSGGGGGGGDLQQVDLVAALHATMEALASATAAGAPEGEGGAGTDAPVLAAETSSGGSGSCAGPLLLLADVGASTANAALAAALKVVTPPVFHIYRDMMVRFRLRHRSTVIVCVCRSVESLWRFALGIKLDSGGDSQSHYPGGR